MRECTLITESRIEECGIVAQVVKCAPRVCGDDPTSMLSILTLVFCAPRVCGDDPLQEAYNNYVTQVLPAYAGMIPSSHHHRVTSRPCSPRMRG